jgi:maltokinase
VSPVLELSAAQRDELALAVRTWLEAHDPPHVEDVSDVDVVVVEVEILEAGAPVLLDVLARAADHLAHVVLGLRRPEELSASGNGEEVVLGTLQTEPGPSVVVDALHDPELAARLLGAVTGSHEPGVSVSLGREDAEVAVLHFGDHLSLSVFPWPPDGPHPAIEFLVGLDEAGFNHLAPPLARWQRAGRDLGLVQEQPSGTADGWSLALTSLRDLYASGGPPERAGGDFGPEARALGVMTARMHLALREAFGARVTVLGEVVPVETLPGVEASAPTAILRTHGDFHLGRTARTDHGWVVADTSPGGVVPGGREVCWRSPLADVADLCWSLHLVAERAAHERQETSAFDLASLARAWEERNRRALLAGYLGTTGVDELLGLEAPVVAAAVERLEARRAEEVDASF